MSETTTTAIDLEEEIGKLVAERLQLQKQHAELDRQGLELRSQESRNSSALLENDKQLSRLIDKLELEDR